MGVRTRPGGFRGGIARWVAPEEVREIVADIEALTTKGELSAWCDSSPLRPMLRSRAGRAFVRTDIYCGARPGWPDPDAPIADRERAISTAVLALAESRRYEAIRDYADAHRISLYVALGGDGVERSLMRCPGCDVGMDTRCSFDFYCRACKEHEAAEVSELVGDR